MSEKASILLSAYKALDWDLYIDLSEKITKVNKNSIDENLEFQASLYSHYAGLEALARLDLDKAETRFDSVSSEIRGTVSANLEKFGKITEKGIEAALLRQPEVLEAKEVVHQAQYRYNLLHALVKALEQKKDCLIQMSSNHRAEINLYAK